jgi:hypothetical protein
MHLWCRLIPQYTLTLNVLCQSRINPRLSSEAQLSRAFDFNKTPLAPPGTRVIIHEQTGVRRTWSVHGTDGWYLGPAPEHYRCYTVVPKPVASALLTPSNFPADIRMPRMSSADNATIAAKELTHALLHPAPVAPFATIGNDQIAALIFQQATTPNKPKSLAQPLQSPSLSPRVHQLPRVSSPRRYNTRASARLNQALSIILIQCFPTQHQANSVINQITGQSYEYRHLVTSKVTGHTTEVWTQSFVNELGRLVNGIGTRIPEGTNTIFFINRNQVPTDRKVTYGRIVCTIRPQKKETHRTRLTVGGNLIDYPYDVSTPTADITTAKIIFNSVVSTPNAKFMGLNIKAFYLNTKMERYKYMRLPISIIPKEIIDQYGLLPLVHNGYVYIEIRKGMYGLPQAGIIANNKLRKHLATFGYVPTVHIPGLWKHTTRPV